MREIKKNHFIDGSSNILEAFGKDVKQLRFPKSNNPTFEKGDVSLTVQFLISMMLNSFSTERNVNVVSPSRIEENK